jgi:hypothetical protein
MSRSLQILATFWAKRLPYLERLPKRREIHAKLVEKFVDKGLTNLASSRDS